MQYTEIHLPVSSADVSPFKIIFTVASCLDKRLSFETLVFRDDPFARADFAVKLLIFKSLFLTEVKNETEKTQ